MNEIATISQEEATNKIVDAVTSSLGSLQVGALAKLVTESNQLKASYKIMEDDLKNARLEKNTTEEMLSEMRMKNYDQERDLESVKDRENQVTEREKEVHAREIKIDAKFQVKDQQISGLKDQIKLLKGFVNQQKPEAEEK